MVAERPDFAITELDAIGFQSALARYGSVVLRNAIPPEDLQEVLRRAQDAYFVRDWLHQRGQLPEPLYRGMYEFGHIPASDLDQPNGSRFSILDLVSGSTLWSLCKGLLGPKVAFLLQNCLPRRQGVEGSNRPVPFHQDAAFLGNPTLIINTWIPLISCGETAPGLQVVLEPISEFIIPPQVSGGRESSYAQIELPESYIFSQFGPDHLWAPTLNVGDVIIFSHLTIHRTHQLPQMQQSRISLEIRCMSGQAAAIMQDKYPLLLRE